MGKQRSPAPSLESIVEARASTVRQARAGNPGKPRPAPSLPRLRCLEDKVEADDANDTAAGTVVSTTWRELVVAIDESHWRAKREQADKPQPRRKRKGCPESGHPSEPPAAEVFVPAEVLVPVEAPAFTPDTPVVAPRRYSTPPLRRRIPKSDTAAIELDHPYRVPVAAERVTPPPGSTLNGHGPAEWQTPPPVTVTVATTVRGDVASYMYARRQIDRASFLAARQYQAIYETAAPSRVRSVDVSMPPTGIKGAVGNYGPADAALRAAAWLGHVHTRLGAQLGATGVDLVRDVLAFGSTIEACAIARGDGDDKQAVRFWGAMLRKCLRHLAVVLGFSTSAARRS